MGLTFVDGFLLLVLLVLFDSLSVNASLNSTFRHYEEIHPSSIKIRAKRSADKELLWKIVKFRALGETFLLKLYPDTEVLSPNFTALSVSGNGETTKIMINKNGVYRGYQKTYPKNRPAYAVQDRGQWYIQVWTPSGDVFLVEPVDTFDPARRGSQVMLAYRGSDVLTNRTKGREESGGTPFCRASINHLSRRNGSQKKSKRARHPGNMPNNIYEESAHGEHINRMSYAKEAGHKRHHRSPRGTKHLGPDTCGVMVLVDYKTYSTIGHSSAEKTFKWAAHVIQGVDSVLRHSGFTGDNGVTYGIRMQGLVIYTDYTKVWGGETHFNMEHDQFTDENLLKALFKVKEHSQYCLIHLVTSRAFSDFESRGTYGMATIPIVDENDNNGVCATFRGNARNIGFSIPVDIHLKPHPTSVYLHIMAHEFGHNFGARHDPTSGPCAPDSWDGGPFLMWPHSGNTGRNNKLFSSCSLDDLRPVARAKYDSCFEFSSHHPTVCGDGIVSEGEDCDSGPKQRPYSSSSTTTADPCCTDRCRFSPGSVCSPRHHPCCSEKCRISDVSKTCHADHINSCSGKSHCDGKSADRCPPGPPLPNNHSCEHEGRCWLGRCASFCEAKGMSLSPPRQLEACSCDQNTTAMCLHCCRDMSDLVADRTDNQEGSKQGGGDGSAAARRHCVPHGPALPDGRPCIIGVCNKGVCTPTKNDGKIGAEKDLDSEEEDGSAGKDMGGTLVVTTVVIVAIVVGTLVVVGGVTGFKIRRAEREQEAEGGGEVDGRDRDIEEIRSQLHDLIGHLNESPDTTVDPTTLAIKAQLKDDDGNNKGSRDDSLDGAGATAKCCVCLPRKEKEQQASASV